MCVLIFISTNRLLACQCNGHSSCDKNNKCIWCEGFTEGEFCESCIAGYYGNAVNGGSCKCKIISLGIEITQ